MVGPLIVNEGRVVRPSQLIRSVRWTKPGAAERTRPGITTPDTLQLLERS